MVSCYPYDTLDLISLLFYYLLLLNMSFISLGVCHADDLMHLFPIGFLTNPISPEDLKMSETIVTLWTNFATTG